MQLLFDVGSNRGDAVVAGLNLGFNKIIALEPAPRMFKTLVSNFLYDPRVVPLKFAVSDVDNAQIEFFEADEDGLSTMNIDWLTSDDMPYKGKSFRTISATTITIDSLVKLYGVPDLMKIDVEGAEWSVFRGMTKKYGMLTFEWTDVTIEEHCAQLQYLESLGYTEVAPQFIVAHLEEPAKWYPIRNFNLGDWVVQNTDSWVMYGGWQIAGLRPTADVGMAWAR